jgi:hypothetical protein
MAVLRTLFAAGPSDPSRPSRPSLFSIGLEVLAFGPNDHLALAFERQISIPSRPAHPSATDHRSPIRLSLMAAP